MHQKDEFCPDSYSVCNNQQLGWYQAYKNNIRQVQVDIKSSI